MSTSTWISSGRLEALTYFFKDFSAFRKPLIGIALIIILMDPAASQDKLQQLKNLGRDSLINIAKARIMAEYPDFDYETFKKVRVMEGKEVLYVQFSIPYRYVPLNTSAIYNLSVYLNGTTQLSQGSLSNNAKVSFDTGFYKPDTAYHEVITFIDEATSRDSEISSIKEVVEIYKHDVIIMEMPGEYQVDISSSSTSSGYLVNKQTGEVYDHWHKHKANTGLWKEITN